MTLTDKLKGIFSYFEIDDSAEDLNEEQEAYRLENDAPKMRVAPEPIPVPVTERGEHSELRRTPNRTQAMTEKTGIQRLNDRQQELMLGADKEKKTTIDIKFPKKYEEAPEIVNLLLDNASVLIDFQFMSETQARRCLDYLDGARSVLAGNLKKVSNTMWLLTPVNVKVNIEDLRSATPSSSSSQFDFDMKR